MNEQDERLEYIRSDMEAFDQFPSQWRKALRNSPVGFSANANLSAALANANRPIEVLETELRIESLKHAVKNAKHAGRSICRHEPLMGEENERRRERKQR